MPDESPQRPPIPTLPVYPVRPKGIPVFADQKSQKPFMKMIKRMMMPKPKQHRPKPTRKKDDIKWY